MDVDEENSSNGNDEASRSNSFNVVQTRRFWSPVSSMQLCPSMDLTVVLMVDSNSNTSSSSGGSLCDSNRRIATTTKTTQIHRTMSWQSICKLKLANAELCWSPDGRHLAVASTANQSAKPPIKDPTMIAPPFQLHLHTLEGLMKLFSEGEDGDDTADAAALENVSLVLKTEAISYMAWMHVGKPHPAWKEEEDLVAFYKSKLLISSSRQQHRKHDSPKTVATSINNRLPDAETTPLGILAVVSNRETLSLLAYGRYPIVKDLPLFLAGDETAKTTAPAKGIRITATPDLSHIIASKKYTDSVTILSLGDTSRDYSSTAARYCQVASQLAAIRATVSKVKLAWKSSLKPLDVKLDQLNTLLQKYGHEGSVSEALAQYMAAGKTVSYSNAMDQFFTGVQMNDQLLQRMERSLTSAVANVEQTYRTMMVQHQHNSTTLSQVTACVHIALHELVTARFVLQDVLWWLRSSAAQTKAAGTAANSVQRENAQKRRVGHNVVQRLFHRLKKAENDEYVGTTERVLGLQFTNRLAAIACAVKEATDALEKGCGCESPISRSSFALPNVLAVTTRVGKGEAEIFGSQLLGCFGLAPFRQWAVMVNQTDASALQLTAIPLAWKASTVEPQHHQWKVGLVFPGSILDVAFYNDDGKSSLDTCTGREGDRQALGVLLRNPQDRLELWLVRYDGLNFAKLPLERENGIYSCGLGSTDVPMLSVSANMNARMRELSLRVDFTDGALDARLELSGSRGIGAVYVNQRGGSVAEILDLEDDGDEDEDDEEEDEDAMEE